MARRAPKTFPTAVEGTFRRRVRELDKTTPHPKGAADGPAMTPKQTRVDADKRRQAAASRRRELEARARLTLVEDVEKETDEETGRMAGETDAARTLRVKAIAAGRMAGVPAHMASMQHTAALDAKRAAAVADGPPTPRDRSVARRAP